MAEGEQVQSTGVDDFNSSTTRRSATLAKGENVTLEMTNSTVNLVAGDQTNNQTNNFYIFSGEGEASRLITDSGGTTTVPNEDCQPRNSDASTGQHTPGYSSSSSDSTRLVRNPVNPPGGMDLLKQFFSAKKIPLAVSALVILASIGAITVAVPLVNNRSRPMCDRLASLKHGMTTCNDRTFMGSNCSFACINNHVIKGNPAITCLKDGNWSEPVPSCVCHHCKVGDNCEYSTSWQIIAGALDNMQVTGSIVVDYGGKSFSCKIEVGSLLPKLLWTGICVDSETGTEQDCRDGHTSKSDSAKAAAAELIRRLVAQKQYIEPCDADHMPTVC